MSNSLQSYGVYPNPHPRPSITSAAMLPHTIPQMASKPIAGPANRQPTTLTARGTPAGPPRAAMPQMSQQAYLQQASAQLQNFQGKALKI